MIHNIIVIEFVTKLTQAIKFSLVPQRFNRCTTPLKGNGRHQLQVRSSGTLFEFCQCGFNIRCLNLLYIIQIHDWRHPTLYVLVTVLYTGTRTYTSDTND